MLTPLKVTQRMYDRSECVIMAWDDITPLHVTGACHMSHLAPSPVSHFVSFSTLFKFCWLLESLSCLCCVSSMMIFFFFKRALHRVHVHDYSIALVGCFQ